MAQIFTFKYKDVEDKDISGNSINVLSDSEASRVFLSSRNINVFPCSRRGREELEDSIKQYDPEARLNTERTNRLRTAVNGFTKSFIDSFNTYDIIIKDENGEEYETETTTLIFVLAGYYVEAKNFNPTAIASALGSSTGGTIYAHLSLYDKASLSAEGYFTEILYRQFATTTDSQYLDITYADANTSSDFFVGISFTKEAELDKTLNIPSYNLPLFTYSGSNWELVQTSLLPKVEHGETEDSIKVSGDFAVNYGGQESFKVSEDETTLTNSFTIKRLSEEGEQTSLEITKQGEGTVNVPLHITKATVIDGSFRASTTASVKNLTVGEITQGEVYPTEGTIKAKTHIETPTLEATTAVETPQLRVNRSLEILAKEGATAPAKATIEQVVIGDLTVKVDAELKNSTGKITTYDLDVDTNIDTDTLKATSEVDTPTLKTNTITSDAIEIAIDKQLKVEDNINVGTLENGGYIVAKKDITAEQDLIAKRDIKASEKATVKSLVVGERVSSDSVDPGVITAKELVRTPAMEVNTMTTLNTSIVVSKSLQLNKGFSAKDASTATRITANELWLEDVNKVSIGQVPAVELVHLTTTDTYQVRLKFGEPITIIEE